MQEHNVSRRRGPKPIPQENIKKHKKQKQKQKKKNIRNRILGGGVVLIVLLGLLAAFAAYMFATQYVVPTVAANNPLSILIVGTDVDSHRDDTFDGTKPEKTDALMVVTFNPDTYKVVATSIPRDTAVDYICPQTGEMRGKINEVYPASGNDMDCLVDTVSNFLNIPIDYYIKFNLDQAAAIIDQVGGITITAHAGDGEICQESTDGDNYYCWTDGETYEMDGTEAICYARARHDSEKDYGRGVRQQQVVKATFTAIAETGFDVELIKSLFGMVETNMEAKLLYDYYNYFLAMNSIVNMYNGDTPVNAEAIPVSVWEALFAAANYTPTLGEENEITNETVSAYFTYITENEIVLSDYFIDNYQFVNEAVNGFYVTVDEQRYEISNALRANLGLEEAEPPAYMYEFGTNHFDEKHESENNETYVEEEVVVEEEEVIIDTDNDGHYDDTDMCINDAPVVDDGTGCEYVPVDSDMDGVTDDMDVCEGMNDTIDDDMDGISDCIDEEVILDTDGDGVTDSMDVCEGMDDTLDEDLNGVSDCLEPTDTPPTDETEIDTDGDGIIDIEDCDPLNPAIDTDMDGLDDACL